MGGHDRSSCSSLLGLSPERNLSDTNNTAATVHKVIIHTCDFSLSHYYIKLQ